MTTIQRERQRGIGIVEIMIALTISLVLTAGVFQFYLGSKQSYRLEDALSRLQETGRFAMNAIAHDARMADFWGCGARAGLTVVNNLSRPQESALDSSGSAPPYFSFHQAIAGTNGTGSTPDTLTLRYAQSAGVNVVNHGGGSLNVSPAVQESILKTDDYAVICNPVSADIVRVTAVDGGTAETNDAFGVSPGVGGNASSGTCQQSSGVTAVCFATTYSTAAELLVAMQRSYRIRPGTSGQPGLFVQVNNGSEQELIEGVEDLQVLYGEDTDGDRQADRYVPAGTTGLDMGRVAALQIFLLIRSMEPSVTSEPQPINFTVPGANSGAAPYVKFEVSGTDRRLRQVYTATLTLRNRAL